MATTLPLSTSEQDWFDKCPKSVLFEIAKLLASLANEEPGSDAAIARMHSTWQALYNFGIVNKKPYSLAARNERKLLRRANLTPNKG